MDLICGFGIFGFIHSNKYDKISKVCVGVFQIISCGWALALLVIRTCLVGYKLV